MDGRTVRRTDGRTEKTNEEAMDEQILNKWKKIQAGLDFQAEMTKWSPRRRLSLNSQFPTKKYEGGIRVTIAAMGISKPAQQVGLENRRARQQFYPLPPPHTQLLAREEGLSGGDVV